MTQASIGRFVLSFIAMAATPSFGADASLTVPPEVAAGANLSVEWHGPGAATDFISIDRAGEPDSSYGPYAYPQSNPVAIKVPSTPGDYVVRYHLGSSGYPVLASAPLKVADVSATLRSAPTVGVGGDLSVSWTGPNQPGDFISIDKPDDADKTYGPYAYPAQSNPVKIRAPDVPGAYVVRYHMVDGYRVIGSAPVSVTDQAASVSAPDHAPAGSRISVKWSGPAAAGDFISIDQVASDERVYGEYAYPRAATPQEPVGVRAPDEAGDYVIRYHMNGSYRVLASAPIHIDPVTASLTAPKDVAAGAVFAVDWQGPDNEGDFVTLVKPDAASKTYGTSNGYTRRGNPVRLEAPDDVGDYELRYLTGQNYSTLATLALRVTPAKGVGKLRVVSDSAQPGTFGGVEFILDASGSMLQRIGGERRIEIAKSALVGLTDALPADSGFVLRVFGHKEADSCRTDLEIKQPKIDKAAAVAKIKAITAMNLAKTPIAASLQKVKEDLAGTNGSMLVILMTDGEETCGGNPKAAIESLRSGGVDVRVNIVGFAIDEVGLKETFTQWAQVGNGAFFDAQNAEQLKASVRATLSPTYEVLADGKPIATGTVNGSAVELPIGRYAVRLRASPARDLGTTAIEAGGSAELRY
jgi:hypothetical protein